MDKHDKVTLWECLFKKREKPSPPTVLKSKGS